MRSERNVISSRSEIEMGFLGALVSPICNDIEDKALTLSANSEVVT
jgi:hypothetical protein